MGGGGKEEAIINPYWLEIRKARKFAKETKAEKIQSMKAAAKFKGF